MKSNKTSCNFAVFAILSQSKQFVSQASFQKMTESNIPVFSFEIQWQLVSLQARNRDNCQECLVTDFFSWCTIFKSIILLISITASEYKSTYGLWRDHEPLLSAPEMKGGEIGIVDNKFPKIRPFLHIYMFSTVFFHVSHMIPMTQNVRMHALLWVKITALLFTNMGNGRFSYHQMAQWHVNHLSHWNIKKT